jgi:hypothetical protein
VVLITAHSTTVNIKRVQRATHNSAAGGTEYISLSLGKGLKMHSLKAVHFLSIAAFYIVHATFTRTHCRNQSSLAQQCGGANALEKSFDQALFLEHELPPRE